MLNTSSPCRDIAVPVHDHRAYSFFMTIAERIASLSGPVSEKKPVHFGNRIPRIHTLRLQKAGYLR